MSELHQTYKGALKEAFEKRRQWLNGQSNSDWYRTAEKALSELEGMELPHKGQEEWKYTNFDRVLKHQPLPQPSTEIQASDLLKRIPEFLQSAYIVASYNGELMALTDLPEGVSIKKAALFGELSQSDFPQFDSSAFSRLNTAFLSEILSIDLPANKELEKPILFYEVNEGGEKARLVQNRILVRLGENAGLKLIEAGEAATDLKVLSNLQVNLHMANSSRMTHFLLQDQGENFSQRHQISGVQKRDSVYTNYTMTFTGELIRNDINISLEDSGIQSNLYGLYTCNGKSHVDNHTVLDHRAPSCESNELYKGVMDDHSTAVFNGKVFVQQAAQKTNAYQQNRNILMHENATVNTKPQLEIWADDVKCSHGATVGQLDEDQLFYLRTRGLDETNARSLLVYAFAAEVVEAVTDVKMKDYLLDRLKSTLGIELN